MCSSHHHQWQHWSASRQWAPKQLKFPPIHIKFHRLKKRTTKTEYLRTTNGDGGDADPTRDASELQIRLARSFHSAARHYDTREGDGRSLAASVDWQRPSLGEVRRVFWCCSTEEKYKINLRDTYFEGVWKIRVFPPVPGRTICSNAVRFRKFSTVLKTEGLAHRFSDIRIECVSGSPRPSLWRMWIFLEFEIYRLRGLCPPVCVFVNCARVRVWVCLLTVKTNKPRRKNKRIIYVQWSVDQRSGKSCGFLVSFSDRHIFCDWNFVFISISRSSCDFIFLVRFAASASFGGKFFLAASQNTTTCVCEENWNRYTTDGK